MAIVFSAAGGVAGKVAGKSLERLAPRLEAVRNLQRLTGSREALTAPDHPIAVSKPMCPDCREFFRRHAIHTGRPQIVTDPDGTRLFHPDGRIIPNPGPKDFGPTSAGP